MKKALLSLVVVFAAASFAMAQAVDTRYGGYYLPPTSYPQPDYAPQYYSSGGNTVIGTQSASTGAVTRTVVPVSTISGVIAVNNGVPVVTNGGYVYQVPGLVRYVSTYNQLGRGLPVNVTGYVTAYPTYSVVQPVRITISGRVYEVTARYTVPAQTRVVTPVYNAPTVIQYR